MARIEFEDVIRLLSRNHRPITQTSQSASTLKGRMLNFVNSTGFEGAGATQMANYMTEVHGHTLEAMQSVLLYYLAVLERFNNDLSGVDPNDNTIIDMAYLDEFTGQLQPLQRRFEETSLATRTWYQWAWDFVFRIPEPDPGTLVEYMTQCEHITVEQMNRMRDLDSTYRNAFDEIVRLLDGIDQVLNSDLLTVNGLNVSFDYEIFTNNMKEGLRISDEAVQRVADTFFNPAGVNQYNIDHDAVMSLFQSLVHGVGSEFEYRILVAIHTDERLRFECIMIIYQNIGDWIAVNSNTNIPIRSQELLDRIVLSASEQFIGEFALFRMGITDLENACQETILALEYQLLRIQLLSFIVGTPYMQWQFLDEACLRNFGTRDSINGLPRIEFMGETHRGTCFYGLTNGTELLASWLEQQVNANFDAATKGPNWGLHLIYVALMIGGGIKTISATTGYTIIKTIMNGQTVIYIINDITGQQQRLTAAEIQLAMELEALGVARLGGGGAVMSTPSGYRVIGTSMMTSTAMINEAWLVYQLEIDREAAIYRLSHDDAEGRNVTNSLIQEENLQRREFVRQLNELAHSLIYIGVINYPNWCSNSHVSELPPYLLEQVIDIDAEQRRQNQ